MPNSSDLRRLTHLHPDSPGAAAMREAEALRSGWREYFLPEARVRIRALIAAGEHHSDLEHEARLLAARMALRPTLAGQPLPKPVDAKRAA